jgi:hypothetical protein
MARTVNFFANDGGSFLVLIKKAKEAVSTAAIAEELAKSLHQLMIAFNDSAVGVH